MGEDPFLKLIHEVVDLKTTSARQEGAIAAMKGAMTEVQRNLVVMAENARLTTFQIERVGMTLLEVAEDTRKHLADHEERIAALEAKASS